MRLLFLSPVGSHQKQEGCTRSPSVLLLLQSIDSI
nr:MAG TPA: hypothetical protein [Caudoviricetes sp.]